MHETKKNILMIILYLNIIVSKFKNTYFTYWMIGFDLSVEQSVFFDVGVAVHGPHQPEGVFAGAAALVGLVPEHGRSGTTVDLDVTSKVK
jgi:hypothetical protein